jgi:hypothetical protein
MNYFRLIHCGTRPLDPPRVFQCRIIKERSNTIRGNIIESHLKHPKFGIPGNKRLVSLNILSVNSGGGLFLIRVRSPELYSNLAAVRISSKYALNFYVIMWSHYHFIPQGWRVSISRKRRIVRDALLWLVSISIVRNSHLLKEFSTVDMDHHHINHFIIVQK